MNRWRWTPHERDAVAALVAMSPRQVAMRRNMPISDARSIQRYFTLILAIDERVRLGLPYHDLEHQTFSLFEQLPVRLRHAIVVNRRPGAPTTKIDPGVLR